MPLAARVAADVAVSCGVRAVTQQVLDRLAADQQAAAGPSYRARRRCCRADVGGAADVDAVELLVRSGREVAVALVDQERRVRKRRDLADRGLGRVRDRRADRDIRAPAPVARSVGDDAQRRQLLGVEAARGRAAAAPTASCRPGVVPSGVIVSPSMPAVDDAVRAARPAAMPSNGDSRAICRPSASKCVMNGPYSSDTQNVPSGSATRPSGS